MNNNLSFSYGRPRGFGGGVRPQPGGMVKPRDKPGMSGGVSPTGNTGIVPPHLGGGAGAGMSMPAPQMPGMSYTPGGGMSTLAPDMSGGGMQYTPQQATGGTLSAPAPQMPGMNYGGDQQQMMSLFGGQTGGMMGYGAGLPGGGMTTRPTPGINPMTGQKPQTFGGGTPIIRQQPGFAK